MIFVAVLKIVFSLVLLVGVLVAARKIGDVLKSSPEVKRKIIHCGLGLYALFFPLIFKEVWEVITLCGLTIGLMVAIRITPALRERLGSGLHSVNRISMGEIFFAFSVGLLFFLKGNEPVFYILPILILTLSDAAAALVGTGYAKSTFQVEQGVKSWEGTSFFFLTAWLLSLVALVTLSDLPRESIVPISLIIAIFGTLIEAISWKGLDNLFVPICLFLVMETMSGLPMPELLISSSLFLSMLCFGFFLSKWTGINLHAVYTFVTAIFFFWLVGDWPNLPGPLLVFAAYLYFRKDNEHDLSVVLSIIGTAMFWYVVSEVFNYNTYFVYNLSFGIHLVMLFLLRPQGKSLAYFPLSVGFAWAAMNVRVLMMAGFQERDYMLSFAALAILLLSACFALIFAGQFEQHRAVKQGGAVLLLSAIGIPVTLWL